MTTISSSTTTTTAYKVTGDTTGTLVLQTGAGPTTAMTIDGSQNVGIGTSSPGQRLSVVTTAGTSSYIEVKSGAYTSALFGQNNAGDAYVYNGEAANIRLFTSATERMRIDSSGNVGIGTSSPGAKLSVTTSSAGMQATFGVGTGLNYIAVGSGNTSTYQTRFGYDVSSEYGYIQPYAAAGVADDLAICPSGGNVGIGTSSPTRKFQVSNTSSDPFISIIGAASNEGGVLFGDNASDASGQLRYNHASDAMIFTTNGSERARINSSGALCVGTTGLSNNGNAASFYGAGPAVRIYGTTEASGALAIDKSSATTTTAQQFINFTINNQGTGSGQINANGASQAAFGSFSDERLKENIVDLPPQLSNILALRPVEFDYKAGGHQTGFIAQEMQQVFPDAVCEDGSEENYLTVTGWNKTEAILVKAIQEQQAMIVSQSELITQLTERITALENK